MNYDFSQLNDKEFEVLASDLLSIVFNKRIERFKPGKDSGVDGRFFYDRDKEIILQSKHYLKTGYKGLISKLKKNEVKSVRKLNPQKYIFITSLPLSRENKEEIKKIFTPFIKRSDDIYGQEDLNDILSQNSDIEEKHFKLWITSTNVFNRIINNAIKGRSEYELEHIKNKAYKYVQTENHIKALEILKKQNVLIISGEPGIGKTTLAENICLFYVSKGYKFIDIEESLSEAENVYIKGEKQLFYYDDFLGSNYFEAIENKKDSHIMKFIERIKNDKSKIFVLTSRTNILNSGVHHSNIFANRNIRKNEYLLTIDSMKDLDKAKILYNHIWYSKLNEKFIDEIYKEKKYFKIIKHRNFNPRLIEFITDTEKIYTRNCSEYWDYIQRTLDNPKDIWNDCFKVQNNAFVRNLVFLTVFNGGNITEEELRKSFNKLNKAEGLKSESHTEKDFDSMIKLAIKSFLNRNKEDSYIKFTLFNPSITDFIIEEYRKNIEKLINILISLNSITSLSAFLSLEKDKIILKEDCIKIKYAIIEGLDIVNEDYDYMIYISYLLLDDVIKKEEIIKILNRIEEKPKRIKELSKLFLLLKKYWKDLDYEDYNFLEDCINNQSLDETMLIELSEFLEISCTDNKELINILKENVKNYIEGELDFRRDEIDLSNFVEVSKDHDGAPLVDYEYEDIENELIYIVESIVDELNSEYISKLNINKISIIENVDIDNMVDTYVSYQGEPDVEYDTSPSINIDQDIDDLFERT